MRAALLVTALICLAAPCQSQGTQPQAPRGVPEPEVQRTVIEDDRVRIEELRVRGQTRSVVVRSKLQGVPAYQIGTSTDGRDVTQDRRSEGRSLWQILSF